MKSLMLVLSALLATAAHAELKIGQEAPDFKLKGYDGKEYSLKDYRKSDKNKDGQIVVLEWVNFECPFVRKHYDSKNMQNLQLKAKDDKVVWFSILSSAPKKQGHLEGKELAARAAKEGSKAVTILQDFDGKVGHAYDAKTTPHMYVIDTAGKLAYQGAIDDHASTDKEDIATSKNFVSEAIADLKGKRAVKTSEWKPYGCGIKYQ